MIIKGSDAEAAVRLSRVQQLRRAWQLALANEQFWLHFCYAGSSYCVVCGANLVVAGKESGAP